MSTKLTGDDYLNFWKNRIAKAPEEVAYAGSTMEESEKHADMVMRELEPMFKHVEASFRDMEQPVIVELGCGWGRMTVRLAKRFPTAFVHGYDICGDAIVGAVERVHTEGLAHRTHLSVESEIPESLYKHADLVFTCTCLQHITDESFFKRAMLSVRESVRPITGYALLFENTYEPQGQQGPHVRFKGADDFLKWFRDPPTAFEYHWNMDLTVMDHGEPHRAMLFRRNQIYTR